MNDFFTVRREILPIATKNQASLDAVDTYAEVIGDSNGMDVDGVNTLDDDEGGYVPKASRASGGSSQASDYIIDIREYDVPYYLRVAIDKRASITRVLPLTP
jgi:DNA polymerase epsilon subunit 1